MLPDRRRRGDKSSVLWASSRCPYVRVQHMTEWLLPNHHSGLRSCNHEVRAERSRHGPGCIPRYRFRHPPHQPQSIGHQPSAPRGGSSSGSRQVSLEERVLSLQLHLGFDPSHASSVGEPGEGPREGNVGSGKLLFCLFQSPPSDFSRPTIGSFGTGKLLPGCTRTTRLRYPV
jgi:hypothetical protein